MLSFDRPFFFYCFRNGIGAVAVNGHSMFIGRPVASQTNFSHVYMHAVDRSG